MQHDQSCGGCNSLFGHCAQMSLLSLSLEKPHDPMDKKDDRPREHGQPLRRTRAISHWCIPMTTGNASQ